MTVQLARTRAAVQLVIVTERPGKIRRKESVKKTGSASVSRQLLTAECCVIENINLQHFINTAQ